MKKLFDIAAVFALAIALASCASVPNGGAPALDEEQYYAAKYEALEGILGGFSDLVGHSAVPFALGGGVDLYFAERGGRTAFVTMELLDVEGGAPAESSIGTYELVSFTRHPVDAEDEAFLDIETRMFNIFTILAYYSREAVLNPMETAEVPLTDDDTACLIFDEYPTGGKFDFDGERHGLLLVVEVFEDEMRYAMKYGTKQLIKLLKDAGHYPESDLDRRSVVSM